MVILEESVKQPPKPQVTTHLNKTIKPLQRGNDKNTQQSRQLVWIPSKLKQAQGKNQYIWILKRLCPPTLHNKSKKTTLTPARSSTQEQQAFKACSQTTTKDHIGC